ncbi:MAG: hypothetical protein NT169_13050 [Chloroflexi bacterium]|nr:hypothetical protein [Chloroflexota bacterium]
MMQTDFASHWDELAEAVLSGMKEWRLQHPKANTVQLAGRAPMPGGVGAASAALSVPY